MQPARLAAAALGAVYVVAGVAGFVAAGFSGSGTVLGFQVTVLHNLVNVAIGATGLAAYALGGPASRAWAQGAGAVLAFLSIAGVVVANPFGLIPIGGADVALHAASAIALLYVGFAGDAEYPEEP